jgi:Transport and Golgi organisation 2
VCTVVVSLDPSAAMPLLLLGIRDEFVARSWQPPGRHWPGLPLIGGRDEQAGGTWLAVDPGAFRVACVLNGRGEQAPAEIRRSRGELPLGVLADLVHYDPFHLVTADPAAVTVLSWDGRSAQRHVLAAGTYVITNAGLDPDDQKVRYFGPRFTAQRPSGDPAASVAQAWRPWLDLAAGDGLPPDDPRAIRVHTELPDGRVWGTTSVSYVALADDAIRYDFQPVPGTISAVRLDVAVTLTAAGRR